MYALGIQFEVNLPADIQKNISGFSIVRVERKSEDRTVLGVGMGSWMYRFGKKGNLMGSYRCGFNAHMATWQSGGNWVPQAYGEIRNNLLTMDCPDFLINQEYPTAGDCDWIEVLGELGTGGSKNSYENDFIADDDDHFYRKFYSHAIVARLANRNASREVSRGFDYRFFKPEASAKLNAGGALPGSYTGSDEYFTKGIHNFGIKVDNGGDNINYYSTGCETLFLRFGGASSVGSHFTSQLPEEGVMINYPHPDSVLVMSYPDESKPNKIYFHQSSSGATFDGTPGIEASLSADDDDGGHVNEWKHAKVQEKSFACLETRKN